MAGGPERARTTLKFAELDELRAVAASVTVPGAILEASHYVELYDDELDEEVYRIGIHTLPAWLPDDMEPETALEQLDEDKLRGIVLNGGSSATPRWLRGLLDARGSGSL